MNSPRRGPVDPAYKPSWRPRPVRSALTALVATLHQYARLMRLDKPVGIWLLLWPTLWALWIAGEGRPEGRVLIVFLCGVVVTRSAGCVINDFADLGAGQTAGRGADQGTHQGTADATQRSTDRAGDHTDGKTDAGTGERTRSTGGAAGHGTDDTAGHSADVTGQDMGRLAARTLKTHGNTPCGNRREKTAPHRGQPGTTTGSSQTHNDRSPLPLTETTVRGQRA